MDTVFFLRVALSFLLGGIWVILVTVLADRYGSKIGGLVAGIPSTAIFVFAFLAWIQGIPFAVQSTTILPVGVGVENIYILALVLMAGYGLWQAIVTALGVWFLLSYWLIVVHFDNFLLSLTLYGLSTILVYYFLEYILHVQSIGSRKIVYTPAIIFMRGLISGTIIASAVVVGRIGGPIFGGMGAAFPAMITSTMIITYLAHGAHFAAATMKSAVPGLISLVIYSVMVRLTYASLGIIAGTALSLLVTLLSSYVIYTLLVKRLR